MNLLPSISTTMALLVLNCCGLKLPEVNLPQIKVPEIKVPDSGFTCKDEPQDANSSHGAWKCTNNPDPASAGTDGNPKEDSNPDSSKPNSISVQIEVKIPVTHPERPPVNSHATQTGDDDSLSQNSSEDQNSAPEISDDSNLPHPPTIHGQKSND